MRQNYDVTVIAIIKHNQKKFLNPGADSLLEANDTLVLSGERKHLKKLIKTSSPETECDLFMDHLVFEVGTALVLVAIASVIANKIKFSIIPFLIILGMLVGPHAPKRASLT